MKKRFSLLGFIAITAIIGFGFIACGGGDDDITGENGNNMHTHSYSTTWSSSATQHWKECTGAGCDAKTETANHSPAGGICLTCQYDNTPPHTNKTPVASDYEIANLYQKADGYIITAVTITAKSGKSPGAISNIRYAGNTSVPQTPGTYAVYFAVAEATGWNAAPDIFAGYFVIEKYLYNIGETGPGGGKIFYDKGSVSDGWRYLEAAPENQGTSLAWASSGYTETSIAGTGTAIGTGKANTAAILAIDANAPAAKACADYRGGGKDDWFLPSKDELNEMYKARNHLGISSGYFWSSSQGSYSSAWHQGFSSGGQDGGYKGNYNYVRAVRAF